MGIRITIISLLLLSPALAARPISYSGGSTLMAFSDSTKHSLYYHYSPSYKYAIGVEVIKDRYFKNEHAFFRFTYLINRKNTQNSQRNLYLQSGISSDGLNHHFYGLHGDWETRRLFAGFGYKHTQSPSRDYDQQFAQIGFAPYLGDYGDLHTWLLLKSKKDTRIGDVSTYPVLRFFKGNFYVELGYDKNTQWDAHLMYRF